MSFCTIADRLLLLLSSFTSRGCSDSGSEVRGCHVTIYNLATVVYIDYSLNKCSAQVLFSFYTGQQACCKYSVATGVRVFKCLHAVGRL